MQVGEYIVDRWMVGIIRAICQDRGVSFSSYSDDWLLELTLENKTSRILGYRFDLNNSVAASIAQDKVATYQVLQKSLVPAVPHVLVRTKVSDADEGVMKGWQAVVIKPLVGTSGHGVRLFDNIHDATLHVERSTIAAWAAAPFIDIQREVRVILLDGNLLVAYEKEPAEVNGLKMFNLGLGAIPKDIELSSELLQLAISAQLALGLRLSTVDIIEDEHGEYRVLEINDSIMMEHYARHSESNHLKTKEVYSRIIDAALKI